MWLSYRKDGIRKEKLKLTGEVKISDLGFASPREHERREGKVLSKEDQRSAELAERAQSGDYDDGLCMIISNWVEVGS